VVAVGSTVGMRVDPNHLAVLPSSLD
jgi:hypothetical protein